jgi:DnaK suppressor protein
MAGAVRRPVVPARLPLPFMDTDQARARLLTERADVAQLIRDAEQAQQADLEAEGEVGDTGDAAQPLADEGTTEAVAGSLRERLEAIDRALKRLDDGTYGRSVRSGLPIPEERLEADPAAELTVEEARAEAHG